MLRIRYGTLHRMLKANEFVPPVYGHGRKLVFDPDAVEAWIKAKQSLAPPAVTTSSQRKRDKKSFDQRQAVADATLQRHAENR